VVLKYLDGVLFFWTLLISFRTSKLHPPWKMTWTPSNVGFDLSLGRFVNGWSCSSHRLQQWHLKNISTWTLLMNLHRICMKCYICQNEPICNTQTHTWIDTRTHLKIVLSLMDSKQNHLMWVFMTRISQLQNKSMNFGENLNPKQPIHSHGYKLSKLLYP
jgi:hypothetical protein